MRSHIFLALVSLFLTTAAFPHDQNQLLISGIADRYQGLGERAVSEMTNDERELHYAIMRITPATDLANEKYKSSYFSKHHTDFKIYIDDQTYDVFVETFSDICKLELVQVIGFNHLPVDEQEKWVLDCKEK